MKLSALSSKAFLPAISWCVLFLLMNLLNPQPGGTNAPSRFAALQAMSRHGSFQIDAYREYTADWSNPPDGHFYSNKAPGPMFLALPLTFVMDRLYDLVSPPPPAGKLFFPDLGYQTFVALIFQMIPFVLVVLWSQRWLADRGVSREAQRWTVLALLFGNTASIFMNSYFGHGITAVWVLLAFLTLVTQRWAVFGLSLGFALLCDYSVAMLLPAFALAFALHKKASGAAIKHVLLGALLPAVLWIYYHQVCFGSPFTLPQKFQNPEFLDAPSSATDSRLWGALSLIPNPQILWKLLFGSERGVLATQPWFLCVWVALFFSLQKQKLPRELLWICALGFPLLLWMNASFNGWHGGHSAGPRYLSAIFPLGALAGAFLYDRGSPVLRKVLWILLSVSLVLRLLIYIDWVTIPVEPLWPYYLQVAAQFRFRPWMKITLCLLAFWACWRHSGEKLRLKRAQA